jgi:serine/threonine protein kinase, bacterial
MTVPSDIPPGAQLEAGTLLADRYRIMRKLRGSVTGSVYLAEDQRLANRIVAVKEIIDTIADESDRANAIEYFNREAELLARLDHPAIPAIYDYFLDNDRRLFYVVFKYIDGVTMSQRQEDSGGRIDEVTVTEWAIEICDVLDYLHSQKPPIIYRDLKPENLMLDARNRVTLVDFGIARIIFPVRKGVTAIGTMGYAPPELFSGEVEAASDVYTLGATMFHLLTGVDPKDDPLLIFDFTKNPKPRQLNPELSLGIEALICCAVEYRPEDRWPTIRAFGHELEKHLRKLKEITPL